MNKAPLLALAILLATCCFAQTLLAQNVPPKRKYKIDYQTLLPNSSGNTTPTRVRITRVPAVPLANEQHFHVTIHSNWNTDIPESCSTATELTIPAGKTSAEVELLFSAAQSSYSKLLIEQGRAHTRGSGDDLFHDQIESLQSGQRSRSWLLISSNAPKEPNTLSQTVSATQGNAFMNGSGTISPPNFNKAFRGNKQVPGLKKIFGSDLSSVLNQPNWHALQPNELPQTWVGLASIGRILISNDELKSIAQVPAYRKIIQQWVASGGYLYVFNSDNSLSHADSVFPTLLGKEQTTSTRRWQPLNPAQTNRWKDVLLSSSKLSAKNKLASSPYGNGLVVVMVAPEKLSSVRESIIPYPSSIANQYIKRNRHERNSPIPGVGKPPIALFGVFTALFLFLIGPVILVVVTLNSDRRFLFFLVPLFSFLTCSSILCYAMVVDFNKQLARTETITVLDSRTNVAFTQVASAYYCGNQPPYYSYDTDTLIQTSTDQNSGYRIRQLPEENRLTSPRIQPRKLHEVYTAKPYSTQQRFRVTESAKQPGTPEVTNLLGSRINRAAFEFKGKIYLVEDVAPKQTALGVEVSKADCHAKLYKTISEQQTFAGKMLTDGGSPFFRANGTRINSAISKFRTRRPQTGQFVAIIDTNPAIEPLIEPFDYKLQLHVVHGKHN